MQLFVEEQFAEDFLVTVICGMIYSVLDETFSVTFHWGLS